MYDGTMSMRVGVKLPPSRVLTGKYTGKYYVKENWN